MRVQKSVYYMTDSELRAYKRRKRQMRIVRNRLLATLVSICLIAFFAVCYFSIKSSANTGNDDMSFKYYTQITIANGDTLWTIADDYIDYSKYRDKAEYVAEVQSINNLNDTCDIRSGQTLIMPYYSSEFIE